MHKKKRKLRNQLIQAGMITLGIGVVACVIMSLVSPGPATEISTLQPTGTVMPTSAASDLGTCPPPAEYIPAPGNKTDVPDINGISRGTITLVNGVVVMLVDGETDNFHPPHDGGYQFFIELKPTDSNVDWEMVIMTVFVCGNQLYFPAVEATPMPTAPPREPLPGEYSG